ncbi:helix-turn-helix transcriptional regulator [Mycolicibacterium sp. XJ1819]
MCEYLDTRAVSEQTGIPAATLRYWRHADTGPASFTLGRRVVYRRDEVERWITAQEQATGRGGAAHQQAS